MKDELSLGLLGCGFFGRALADGVSEVPGARIHAVADTSPDAAAATGAKIGAQSTTPDQLWQLRELDAVLIATPNDLHVQPVLAACEAGLHVFVEKPMALTPGDCRLMITAADAAGVQLVVGHILRTLPASRRLKAIVDGGDLGAIHAAHGSLARWMPRERGSNGWWKQDSTRTGGELLHEIHILDLLCWLLGDVDEVAGLTRPGMSGLVLRYGDTLATYELSTVHRLPSWGVQIHGSLGSASLDLRAGTLTVMTDNAREVSGIYDDDDSDESLREYANRPAGYNRAGAAPALWMQRAIALELAETLCIFRGSANSPLLQSPDRAIQVAHQLLPLPRHQLPGGP